MYYTYLLQCSNGSLYAGITTDPKRRLSEHRGIHGKGAKYTRLAGADRFLGIWESADRAAASRLEYRLKHLTHAQKLEFAAQNRFELFNGKLNASDYTRIE